MFFTASKLFSCITSPLVWILICFLLGWFLKNKVWKKRMLLAALIMLLVFSNPFIINQVLGVWEMPSRNANTIQSSYDVGIVLGGSMRFYNNNTQRIVYGSSVDRVMQAIDLYQNKKIKKILLSGGSGYVLFKEWREATWLAEMLYKCNIPKEDVIIENDSRNTYENAQRTSEILSVGGYGTNFLLITSATHMRRSLLCFAKAGLTVHPYPVDERSGKGIYTPDRLFIPDSQNISNWDVLIHEWIGMLTYKVAGYI